MKSNTDNDRKKGIGKRWKRLIWAAYVIVGIVVFLSLLKYFDPGSRVIP